MIYGQGGGVGKQHVTRKHAQCQGAGPTLLGQDGEGGDTLQGELITGGECDISRIEEQLRAAALQFNTSYNFV